MQAKRNLAHRMGRWSGTHPKTAIFGWIAFVLIAFFVGNLCRHVKELSTSPRPGRRRIGPCGQDAARRRLRGARQRDRPDRGEERHARRRHLQGRRRRPHLAPRGLAWTSPRSTSRCSPTDGQSALLGWDLTGDPVDGAAKLPAMTAIVDDVQQAHSERHPSSRPAASTFEKAIDDKLGTDFQKAEQLSTRSR